MATPRALRLPAVVLALVAASLALGGSARLLGACGPFTDVSDATFCPFVLEIFSLGITTGTTPTTFDPAGNVTRLQMAAFLSRTVDGLLKRGGRRASLNQFWIPQNENALQVVTVGPSPKLIKSDGADVFVGLEGGGTGKVERIRASDGKVLQTWTGNSDPYAVIVAKGLVFFTTESAAGRFVMIDPTQPAGAETVVASTLGSLPGSIAFDGARFWTANHFFPGSISIVTPGATIPWTVTTITTGFSQPWGTVFDGGNVWIADSTAGALFKLDSSGAVVQTVTVGTNPNFPAFDGANIWVPNTGSASVSVVRASSGAVLQTLTVSGTGPTSAAFDGERVLVTVANSNQVSLWKAADLTPLGTFSMGPGTLPFGACSDGTRFWITLRGAGSVARF